MSKLPYNIRLLLLAVFMLLLWLACALSARPEEERLWNVVRSGQTALWEKQLEMGISLSEKDDKLKTGFIGVEWSSLTTTLGSAEAKRTSANPLWTARFLDWFDELGLKKGDKIAIFSSASFPAMLFSAIAAAEDRGLEILLSVSLGASTWGANREEFPWPLMEMTLSNGGFIKTRSAFYTPGGGAEIGGGYEPEVMRLLGRLSEEVKIPLIITRSLDEAIRYKSRRLAEFEPKLFVSIGGSNANLGASPDAAEIPNGLLLPHDVAFFSIGDGVIAEALRRGVPVLNILNIRKLALEAGIPWDTGLFIRIRHKLRPWAAFTGLTAFFAVLFTHKRWAWETEAPRTQGKKAEK